MKIFTALILAAVGIMCLGGVAKADENWPSKPVTIIVGYAAGGASDVTTRIVADKLQQELGQPFVIQNKGGAGGQIGLRLVGKARPDGYTAYGGSIINGFAASLIAGKKIIRFDAFAPVGGYLAHERALYASINAPYKNWEEFVAYVKKNPDKISIGASNAWAVYLLKHIAKEENLKYKIVMYKSGSQVSSDFFGGHTQLVEAGVGTPVYQAALDNKATVLIDICNDKILNFEHVPRLVDKGYPDPVLSEYGFLMPKGTSPIIVSKFEATLEKVLKDQELIEKLAKLGTIARFLPTKKFTETCTDGLKSLEVLIQSNEVH